ncbi:MAG: DUF308 domain-containing protein [Clostridia bacterium]|nr:DUF308 domain-containing protein [Clostridia bacterium]
MKRANIVKEARLTHVIASALLLLSGMFLLIWHRELGELTIRWLLGANFVVTGAARLLGYFANDLYRLAFQYDLGMGGLCVILGVLIFISPEKVLESLPYVFGTYVIIDGLLKLQTAFDAKAFGMRKWIGLLISAALVCVCGVMVLVGSALWSRMVMIAIALVMDGAENIWNTMATVRVRAKKRSTFEALLPEQHNVSI